MKLAPIFQDHAVLQRNISIPVWGMAGPDEAITVSLGNVQTCTTAGSDGRWLVRFPAQPAGGPFELIAESASGRVVLSDILIGEVWVCSGQSNMQWSLSASGTEAVKEMIPMPQVRVLNVDNPARLNRHEGIKGRWAPGTIEALSNFSGVGCWFARKIQEELGVPIGLIGTAWGGTRIQAWISREALMQDATYREEIRAYENFVYSTDRSSEDKFVDFADWEKRGAPQDQGNRGLAEGWAAPDFNDGTWSKMTIPSRWQDEGHAENGILWFRQIVAIPSEWMGRNLELHLGSIDKHDDTWVNGEWVGGLSRDVPDSWCKPRIYPVAGRLTQGNGQVCIAVRARSHVYHGGLCGPAEEMYLKPAGDSATQPVPLAGKWRYAVEQDWGVVVPPGAMFGTGGDNNPNSLNILFNSRIAPLLPYAIRGALWYQGESNAHEGDEYRRLMPMLIRDWRRAWGQGDFTFLQVQLANFKPALPQPARSEWAELREAQFQALSEPNSGMAVIIDVGEAMDIHPRDKKSVGLRLATWALAETYGRGGLPSGPLYSDHAHEADGRIRIHFRHATGLRTRDGQLTQEIAIAAHDRKFIWAYSAIEGETLVVWHPDVPKPLSVRYGWADNPDKCNLVNVADLPASPFRTDSW